MERSFPVKRLSIIVGLAMALVLPFSAMARPPGGYGGFEMQLDRLDLDETTRGSVDLILDESRAQRRLVRRELHAAREQMRERLAAVDSDEASLLAQAERISVLELEMARQRISTHLELRSVLSNDQMEALVAAVSERPARPGRSFRH